MKVETDNNKLQPDACTQFERRLILITLILAVTTLFIPAQI